MKRLRFRLPGTLALAVFLPLASAQQQTIYTFVGEWTVPRAQWGAFTDAAMKNTVPILEKLVADGTLVEFALTTSVVHTEDGPTHTSWWAATSFAGVSRALAELQKVSQLSEFSGVEHRDRLLRSVVYQSGKTAKLTSGFSHLAVTRVKPGKNREWRELYDKYNKPVSDKLLADGVILGYGVDLELIHTENPGFYGSWYLAPNAESVDKVNAAVAAAQQQATPVERRAIAAAFADVTVAGSHRDSLDRIIYYVHK